MLTSDRIAAGRLRGLNGEIALSSSDELKSGGENLLVDPIPSLTIRGGYRYEWGDVRASGLHWTAHASEWTVRDG